MSASVSSVRAHQKLPPPAAGADRVSPRGAEPQILQVRGVA